MCTFVAFLNIHSLLYFFSFHLGCNKLCITAYMHGLPSLPDNSKYVAALLFFKAFTKGYVVNSCLVPPLIEP